MPPSPAFFVLHALAQLWPLVLLSVLVSILGAYVKSRSSARGRRTRRGPRRRDTPRPRNDPGRLLGESDVERTEERARTKGRLGEALLARRLDVHAIPHVDDVYVRSGRRFAQVDHVALMGDHLLVIETKNYDGMVLADPERDQWAHYVGGGPRHSFQNALVQNARHVEAVTEAIGSAAQVRSLVVFVGKATFPQGRPHGVLLLSELDGFVAARRTPRTEAASGAWQALLDVTSATDREEAARLHMGGVMAGRAARGRRHFPKG